MQRHKRFTSLAVLTLVGMAGVTVAADEPKPKRQPKIVHAKKAQHVVAKPRRIFASLLQKGQIVSLYQMRREAPTGYIYQIRIVTEKQKKHIEDLVAAIRKESQDHQSKIAKVEQQRQESTDREEQNKLRRVRDELRGSYRPRQLPTDLRYAKFYKINDVGSDYVGLERRGVETFYRLSSIHRIVRGANLDEQ